MIKKIIAAIAALSLVYPTALAAKEVTLKPVASEDVAIRYVQGVPTASVADENGGVMVTQTEEIYGRVRLRVAFSNASNEAVNFGIENITATIDGEPVNILTADDLEQIAKRKAGWTNFAIAMAGGLGAAAANMNANRTYTTVGRGPFGSYYSQTTVHDPALAMVGTAAAVGGAAYGISQVNSNLEKTLAAINDNVIQTTTVDPLNNYGGLMVIDKFKLKKGAPGRLELVIRRSAADTVGYRVSFQIAQ